MTQPRPSVLVVDDEEVIRTLLVESLSLDGFDVTTADSGEAALRLMRERRFDLAVTDMKMPGMDGIETLRALKQANRELQVVVMTGYASLDTAVNALKGGAFDYIEKPFKPIEVSSLLRKAMDRSVLEGLLATYGASRVLLASIGQTDLCRMTVDLAQGLLHADSVGLILRPTEGEARETCRCGTGPEVADETLEALLCQAERLGRPFCLPSDEDGIEEAPGTDEGLAAALVYPLMEEESALGALCAFRGASSTPFTAGDLQRGILFASEVTRVLSGARLKSALATAAAKIERLRERLDAAHGSSLQGRIAVSLSRGLEQPLRRIGLNARDLEAASARIGEPVRSGGDLPGGTERAESLRRLQRNAALLVEDATAVEGVMQSVRSLARAEGARAAETDPNSILEAVIETVRGEIDTVASLEVGLGAVPPVACRPGRLGSALLAVLSNAVEAVRAVVGDSGERGRIAVRTRREGSQVTIVVEDDGCGIPGRMREKVFTPWYSTKVTSRHAGLGLSLARRIIEEEHGGEISYATLPGEGTTFTIRIPAPSTGS